jgi:hypothetical protein
MAPLITAAVSLAQYIPDLLQLFGRGEDSAVAQKVLNIAQSISGKDDATQAMAAISASPDAQLAMQKMLLEDKWVQERLDLDNVKSARTMHEKNHVAADELGKHVIRWNLPLAFVLFLFNIVSLHFFKDQVEILLTLGNLTGFLMNSLLKERQDIINFYFGSSLGSKTKDIKNV